MSTPARSFRFAVNVTPRPGILDPQGRAVEQSLPHLGIAGVHRVRVGRRVELTVEAPDEDAARSIVERLASELLSNPLIEAYAVEPLGAASSAGGTSAASPAAASPMAASPTVPGGAEGRRSGAQAGEREA
jgi:phosphoribosylformylglycinamidine synthase subunit PurS